jgi:hypothetical protein
VDNENKSTSPQPSELNRSAGVKEMGLLLRSQWPKYLVDVLVIILSITLSFTFDSLKEESNRRASEEIYLKALLGDITSDISELKKIIASTENVVNQGNWLVNMAERPREINMDQFASAVREVMQRPNFISKDATFSDLTSSGNMLLVEDITLKASLFDYHRLYESVRAVEVAERETLNSNIAPYLMKYFSIKGLTGKGRVIHKGVNLDQLLQDDDFTNIISLRLVNRSELLDDYRQELDKAEKIKAQLTAKID